MSEIAHSGAQLLGIFPNGMHPWNGGVIYGEGGLNSYAFKCISGHYIRADQSFFQDQFLHPSNHGSCYSKVLLVFEALGSW